MGIIGVVLQQFQKLKYWSDGFITISVGIVLFHTFQNKPELGIGILLVLLYILGSNFNKITKLIALA